MEPKIDLIRQYAGGGWIFDHGGKRKGGIMTEDERKYVFVGTVTIGGKSLLETCFPGILEGWRKQDEDSGRKKGDNHARNIETRSD